MNETNQHEWTIHDSGRYLTSSDFKDDVIIRIDGDFESDEERFSYADRVRNALNGMKPAREFYYKVFGCPAKNAYEDSCICWHDASNLPVGIQETDVLWRDKKN
ncbi:MAG TPA: hypothetical protein VFM18_22580 [Methanosarcina sp.]|nr:hypothetical protein [Methanosarcina sp.]